MARVGADPNRPLARDIEHLLAERAAVWRASGPELRTDGSMDSVWSAFEDLCASP